MSHTQPEYLTTKEMDGTEDISNNGNSTTVPVKLIIISACGGGGAFLLIVVVVVVVVCLRRRLRRGKQVAPPIPPPEELPYEPDSPDKYQRRNSDSDINNVRPAGQRNEFQLLPTPTPNSRLPQIRPEYYDSSDDDDDDRDYVNTSSPDYENNPISVARVQAEADRRLEQRRNGPSSSPLAHSQVLISPTAGHPTPLRNAHTLKPELAAGGAAGDRKQPPPPSLGAAATGHGRSPPAAAAQCFNRDHAPLRKLAYINTSRSLEELDKRTVPLPPPMPPSSPSLAKRKPAGPAPPPKSHKGNVVKGYVNQPL